MSCDLHVLNKWEIETLWDTWKKSKINPSKTHLTLSRTRIIVGGRQNDILYNPGIGPYSDVILCQA